MSLTFYPYSMGKGEMLHGKQRYFVFFEQFRGKMSIFEPELLKLKKYEEISINGIAIRIGGVGASD